MAYVPTPAPCAQVTSSFRPRVCTKWCLVICQVQLISPHPINKLGRSHCCILTDKSHGGLQGLHLSSALADINQKYGEQKQVREFLGLFRKAKWPAVLRLGKQLAQRVPHVELYAHMAAAHFASQAFPEAVSLPLTMQSWL